MKPTFIGIGAQKCASTWLYRMLGSHPQVGVSEKKEIDFFSYHFDHGFQWYEHQFEQCLSKKAVGEISPSYFCEPAVPARIHQYLPTAKILISLRDPVVRALSNHRHEVRVGHLTGKDISFDAGLANNPMYIEQGLYATHLKRWLQYFPREQILVLLMEDIEDDPSSSAKTVYEFLGVQNDHEPAASEYFNRSYANRYQVLADLKDSVYGLSRNTGLHWAWRLLGATGLRSAYRHLNTTTSASQIPAPNQETLARLRRQFAPEIQELSRLINRPLDGWL